MEYILANHDWMEVGYLDEMDSLDVDVGDTNDYELVLDKKYVREKGVGNGFCFFVPGTEYGGILEEISSVTDGEEITYKGYTWRGLLEQLILEPPSESAYLTVSGDANRIIELVLGKGTGLFFSVPNENSGIEIKTFQFRYESALTGLSKMLEKYDARMDIKAEHGAEGEKFRVVVKAVPIRNYSDELQYDGDDNISVSVHEYGRGINHLICLGSGELENRMVVHLYAQLDGSIGRKPYYTGTKERTAVYDYSSASSEDELISGGTDRLKELMNYKSADMNIEKADLEIGDVVTARDRDAGVVLSRPIVNKVLKYSGGLETIEIKPKGEN